jgi:hypothetical protein
MKRTCYSLTCGKILRNGHHIRDHAAFCKKCFDKLEKEWADFEFQYKLDRRLQMTLTYYYPDESEVLSPETAILSPTVTVQSM